MTTSTVYYPKATKTSLGKFLRVKGFEIPSLRKAMFYSFGKSFWLEWPDKVEDWHKVHYFSCCGRPVLSVDGNIMELTLAEVIESGLVVPA